jgi:hypothetical protein
MSDEPFYTPSLKRAPLSVGQPGEKLYEFCVEHDRYLFELRDHGELLGVEVQIFVNGCSETVRSEAALSGSLDGGVATSRSASWASGAGDGVRRCRAGTDVHHAAGHEDRDQVSPRKSCRDRAASLPQNA